MNARNLTTRPLGVLALTIGGVTLIGVVSLILFFSVGGGFGTLNDLANGVEAILSAVLAWQMHPWLRTYAPRWSIVTLIAACGGALIASVGSALIIFNITGWYLAGLYTMVGYALISLWLFGLNDAALHSFSWPRRLAQLGRLTAGCMAIGFLASPGIPGGVDDVGAAPWFVNLGLPGSLGWMFLYPCWCVWLGRLLASNSVSGQVAPQA